MVFNATFNTISVILWLSVLFRGKSEYPEKITDLPQVRQTLAHNVDANTHRHERDSYIRGLLTTDFISSLILKMLFFIIPHYAT